MKRWRCWLGWHEPVLEMSAPIRRFDDIEGETEVLDEVPEERKELLDLFDIKMSGPVRAKRSIIKLDQRTICKHCKKPLA